MRERLVFATLPREKCLVGQKPLKVTDTTNFSPCSPPRTPRVKNSFTTSRYALKPMLQHQEDCVAGHFSGQPPLFKDRR